LVPSEVLNPASLSQQNGAGQVYYINRLLMFSEPVAPILQALKEFRHGLNSAESFGFRRFFLNNHSSGIGHEMSMAYAFYLQCLF
jgi:hypothetical protein